MELGQTVKDRLTGFTGLAIMRHLNISGMERVSVMSKMKDNKLGSEYSFDVNQLEVVDPTRPMSPIPPPEPKFKFRETCRDPITGFVGKVVMRSIHLNGCVKIGLQPVIGKDGKCPKVEFFEEEILESVQPEESKKDLTDAPRRTGGPGRCSELSSMV